MKTFGRRFKPSVGICPECSRHLKRARPSPPTTRTLFRATRTGHNRKKLVEHLYLPSTPPRKKGIFFEQATSARLNQVFFASDFET